MALLLKLLGSQAGKALLMLALPLLLGALHSCQMWQAKATIAEQAENITQLESTKAGLQGRITTMAARQSALQRHHRANDALILKTAQERDAKTAENRRLNHQLNKALQDEKPATVNTILSDDVALALCLRLESARSLPAGDYYGTSAGGAPAREANPGSGAFAHCTSWQGRLTVGALAEWAGALLDHAGDERLDKAAIRARNKEIEDMGKD